MNDNELAWFIADTFFLPIMEAGKIADALINDLADYSLEYDEIKVEEAIAAYIAQH